jgi:NitT/TauT family transport system substrate-binding protein
MKLRLVASVLGIVLLLGVLHVWINVGFDRFAQGVRGIFVEQPQELVIGFLPVTCHLTCPVVDWTTRHSPSGALYTSKRYSEFPTMCEDLAQGTLQAAFLNAPLTVSLVQKNVGVKLVTLGHRDGSAIMVRSDSDIREFKQLEGKRVLIPSKSSNQQLWLARLCKQNGMELKDLDLPVCPPPEMPLMLVTGKCDAYAVGEPFCAKAEMDGSGRVLLQVKDSWPDFISCALVVREELIRDHRDVVQELVDGIHGSGLWLEEGVENRFSAAEVVGKYYYNQDPALLKFVLSKPLDRVRYNRLTPLKEDFDEIMQLGLETGMYTEFLPFERYVDTSFSNVERDHPVPMPPDDGQGVPMRTAPAPPAGSAGK